MNKKRFIKLMMARGYSRNTATALAAQVSRYGSYAAMYQQYPSIQTPTQLLPYMIRGMYNAFCHVRCSGHNIFQLCGKYEEDGQWVGNN